MTDAPVTGFPLPGTGRASVAVPAPGPGKGNWVGAPSVALDPGGGFVVAYRVRVTAQRGAATLVARSDEGERLTTLARLAGPGGRLVPEGDGPVADVRYLDILPLPGGGHRLWYEAPLPDGGHELLTELVG